MPWSNKDRYDLVAVISSTHMDSEWDLTPAEWSMMSREKNVLACCIPTHLNLLKHGPLVLSAYGEHRGYYQKFNGTTKAQEF